MSTVSFEGDIFHIPFRDNVLHVERQLIFDRQISKIKSY